LLALKPSKFYLAAIAIVHALACVALYLTAVNFLLKTVILALVLASMWLNIQQNLNPAQLVWRSGNRWFIDCVNGDSDRAELHGIDFFSRWLVIISLRIKGRRSQRHIIVFDALSANTFRLFRVRLRVEGFALLNPDQQ